MKIIIKTTRIQLTPAFKSFIEEKIGGLEKFAKVFQSDEYYGGFLGKGKPKSEACVEIEKTTRHHKRGPFFRAECQMRLPGKSIRSECQAKDVRQAVAEVKDALQRQLTQYQRKQSAKYKRCHEA